MTSSPLNKHFPEETTQERLIHIGYMRRNKLAEPVHQVDVLIQEKLGVIVGQIGMGNRGSPFIGSFIGL